MAAPGHAVADSLVGLGKQHTGFDQKVRYVCFVSETIYVYHLVLIFLYHAHKKGTLKEQQQVFLSRILLNAGMCRFKRKQQSRTAWNLKLQKLVI